MNTKDPTTALASMLLALHPHQPMNGDAESLKKFQDFQAFVANLKPEDVDSVVLTVLSKSDEKFCAGCGQMHDSPVLDTRVLGDAGCVSAMLLIASAAHTEAMKQQYGSDPLSDMHEYAGGRTPH